MLHLHEQMKGGHKYGVFSFVHFVHVSADVSFCFYPCIIHVSYENYLTVVSPLGFPRVCWPLCGRIFPFYFCRGKAREAGAAARDRDQDALRQGKGHFHAAANPFGARGAHQDLR